MEKNSKEISKISFDYIKLRVAKPGDAERLLEIYTPYVLDTAITFEWDVPTVEEFRSRIVNTLELYPYLVCEIDHNIVAYAYAHRYLERAAYAWTAELSVYVDKSYCLHYNIGTALYTALIEILRLQNVQNLYALVADKNEKSFGLHRKVGFEKIAVYNNIGYKFNEWHDVAVFQMLLGSGSKDVDSVPAFPDISRKIIEEILGKSESIIVKKYLQYANSHSAKPL